MFTFDIQAQEADAADIPQTTSTRRVIALEPGQPRYRILIVDDKQDNRRLLFKLLNPFGFDLREAENGQEAIDIWEIWKPHLIWMDMRMPVLDGYEATEHIKSDIQHSKSDIHTVIIAVTASAYEEERAVVLSVGCDDFLWKPFKDAEIFEMLHTHLGVRFVYEEGQQGAGSREQVVDQKVLTPEVFATLPAEWVANLKQGAEAVDVELLFSIIEQIRGHDATLADALARLVEDFEYDKILLVLQQVEE